MWRIVKHFALLLVAGVTIGLVGTVVVTSNVPAAPPVSTGKDSARWNNFQHFMTPPPSLSHTDLESLLKAISSKDGKSRQATIKTIQSSTRADAVRLHGYLHRKTRISGARYKKVLRSIGALVPNSRGQFRTPAKNQALDWLGALSALKPRSQEHASVINQSLLSVALLRGLARSRHPDAALSILRFAYRHRGAFRDECGKQIRAMGVHAVPGMLRSRIIQDPLTYKMKRYAAYQLDRLDCTRAMKALSLANADLKAEMLHAYGEVRDPSAVKAVLKYTNADNSKIRLAARWAMLRYVSGRPPKVAKRRLKIAGGGETSEARSLYYTYRQLAFYSISRRLAKEMIKEGDTQSAADLTRRLSDEGEARYLVERLFALFDKQRDKRQLQQTADAMSFAAQGKLKQALEEFDKILTATPFHSQRTVMAPHYHKRAMQLMERKKYASAITLFTKSIHLDPTGVFVSDARGRRALAEALSITTPGARKVQKLSAAMKHAPHLHQARQILTEIEKEEGVRITLAGGLGGSVAIALIVALSLIRRRFSR